MSRGRELLLAAFGAAALTVALTYPLARHPATLGRTDNFDGQFSVWNVAWVARTLVVDPFRVFDANIFYPHRNTLAYSETNLGAGALAIPFYWATRNPYVALNGALLLSFVLSAIGTYFLVRHLVHDRAAATVSAITFAFCPYALAHTPHIQLMMTAGLPFGMLAFHRVADLPTPGRGAALGAVMAAGALACGYYAVFVALMVGFATLVVAASRGQWTNSRYWLSIGIAAVVSIVLVAPVVWPYLQLQRNAGFHRSLEAAGSYSAVWSSYLASSSYAHAWMLPLIGRWNDVLFPGFVAVIFGAIGAAAGWRARGSTRELVILYGGLGALALWASFGPAAGLYRVLYRTVPMFTLMRAPARFGLVVMFALSVIAAVGVAWTMRKAGNKAAIAIGLAAAAALELWVPAPWRPVEPIDPGYRRLASLPSGPVLELPVYSDLFAFMRSRYMLASTAHWMPLIDAYSDYMPADFVEQADVLGEFPTLDSFKALERIGARYAIFHVDLYPADAAARLRDRLRQFAGCLQLEYGDERMLVYEIVRFECKAP